MNVTVEELSQVQRKLVVQVPGQQVDKVLDRLYRELNRRVKLKGFRKGRAPRSLLERYYGARVALEAADELIRSSYPQALEKAAIAPLAPPEVDFDSPPEAGKDFSYTAVVDVNPEFELSADSYKGLEITAPDYKVTEDDVQAQLDALRERHAVLVPVEPPRAAREGDIVLIDYEMFDGDSPVEGGKAENVELVLDEATHENLRKAIIGVTPPAELTAEVQFDDTARDERIRGKLITFKINFRQVREKHLPELDDDFARSVSPELASLEELTGRIREELEQAATRRKDEAIREAILEKLRTLAEFELPPTLVKAETERMLSSFKQRLSAGGMDPSVLDENALRTQITPRAEQTVKSQIILARIAQQMEIEVTDEDIEAEFVRIGKETGQPAGVVKEIYRKNNMIASMKARLLEEKTLQAIRANANIKMIDPGEWERQRAQQTKAQEEQKDEAAEAGQGDQPQGGEES